MHKQFVSSLCRSIRRWLWYEAGAPSSDEKRFQGLTKSRIEKRRRPGRSASSVVQNHNGSRASKTLGGRTLSHRRRRMDILRLPGYQRPECGVHSWNGVEKQRRRCAFRLGQSRSHCEGSRGWCTIRRVVQQGVFGKAAHSGESGSCAETAFHQHSHSWDNMDREREGGFSGTGGGWTATKWFPEHDGLSGEIFFNFNLDKRQGEFSEKDADYADDLVAIFASALRDGPRPERTPENDPNLTRIGPTIGKPRKLLSRLAAHYSFSPKSRFAVYQDRSTIWALPIDQPRWYTLRD